MKDITEPQIPQFSGLDREGLNVLAAWVTEVETRGLHTHAAALDHYEKLRAQWQEKHQGEVCPCCGKPVFPKLKPDPPR